MIIYIIKNYINNKVYIGQTTKTLNERIHAYKTEIFHSKHERPIIRAMRKYGFENFYFEILEDNIKTQKELDEREKYYIQKYQSLCSQNGYNIELGGNSIGKHSEETKRKISQAQLGNKNHRYGKVGKENPASKPIIDLVDDIIYDSANLAAKKLNLSASHICSVARGERGSCGGHVFRYLDRNNNIIQPKKIALIKYKNIIKQIPDKYKIYISPIPCQAEQSEGVTTIQK